MLDVEVIAEDKPAKEKKIKDIYARSELAKWALSGANFGTRSTRTKKRRSSEGKGYGSM